MGEVDRPVADDPTGVATDSATDGDGSRWSLGRVRRGLTSLEHLPLLVLSAAVLTWVVSLGGLILQRQHNIGTLDFDEGIYDQFIWQLAHFRMFDTVRGVSLAGHHASFGLLLLVPLAWLGGGVGAWDVVQTVAVGCTAYPLYFLARDKLGGREWVACGVGLVWLAQPSPQWFVHEGFHPEVVAIPFLIATYLFGERIVAERAAAGITRRTRWGFIACFGLAICWKEDMALALVGMGLVWLVRRQWKLARRVLAVAGLWFVVFGMIVVPHIAGGSVFGGIYDLGSTPGQIARTSVEHPSKVVHKLDQNDALGNGRDLTEPYGFVPLLSPLTLLMGLPQWGLNVISASAFTWDPTTHYQAVPMFALAISLVEGLRFLQRRRRGLASLGLLVALVLSLLSTRWYGPSQLSVKFDRGYWPLTETPNQPERRQTLRLIPSSAGVSADHLLVPQLTHRQIIYAFPNPWENYDYGVRRTDLGDPGRVQYVDVDASLLDPSDRQLLRSIVASGEFRMIYHHSTVYLLHRVAIPGHGRRAIVVPTG